MLDLFAITNPALNTKMGTGEGNVIIGDFFSRAIKITMIIAVLVVFFNLVWGGFQWITSGGEKSGVEAAKHRITNAIIGLVIVASVWAIIVLIGKFLGITILGGPITLPTP